MSVFLEAALQYHAMGLHPIPCRPKEKIPSVQWKDFQTVQPSEEKIRAWWNNVPMSNVAIILGRGLLAVDCDGGEKAEQLLRDQGVFLPTGAPRSRTANGYHVFVSVKEELGDRIGLVASEGCAVDIRCLGYVVAPPSIHPSGARYEWEVPLTDERPPEAPAKLIELIKAQQLTKTAFPSTHGDEGLAGSWITTALRGVGEGLRDATCTRLAGYFLKKGVPSEIVKQLLSDGYARRCTPPFDARDVEKCVQSIARREVLQDEAVDLEPKHISTVLDSLVAQIAGGPLPTLATPFATANHFLGGGFQPGDLVYLGARPGVGKTALGLLIAREAAKVGNVLVISREMTNLALTRRLIAQDARIRALGIRRNTLTAYEQLDFNASVERLRGLPLWLTDEAVSLSQIEQMVGALSKEVELQLLVVDYLQLVRAPREIRERRHQVEAVSQGLKTLAMTYKVPVLCLSSLTRSNEKDKRAPNLSDLRESGELEHDADTILFLHRAFKEDQTTLIIAKNRDGRTGDVDLMFRAESVRFDEVAKQYPEAS